LISELITREEYSLIDNNIFMKLEEKKDQLLKRIKLEKEIINDKKIILSLVPNLIKDLEKINSNK
ncbi:hypothetical protein, partial [Cetobacterium sp.]|uniref:hypothetical protein n=1 Tax=Cetobacterium sp. TaxID=2071632 RepID=UPI003F40828E